MLLATRTLHLNDGSAVKNILIQMFAPEQGEAGAWFCRYTIDWPHEREDSKAWGYDAFQAVILTLQMIGIRIYSSEYHKSGQLMWLQPGAGYGFPVVRDARDMLVGDDKTFDG